MFQRWSDDFQRLPVEDVPTTLNVGKDTQAQVGVLSLSPMPNALRTQIWLMTIILDYFCLNWIDFNNMMGLWTSSPDLSAKQEKLACMSEIDMIDSLDLQAWNLWNNVWELAVIVRYPINHSAAWPQSSVFQVFRKYSNISMGCLIAKQADAGCLTFVKPFFQMSYPGPYAPVGAKRPK